MNQQLACPSRAIALWKPFESELGAAMRHRLFGYVHKKASKEIDNTRQGPLPGHAMSRYHQKCLAHILTNAHDPDPCSGVSLHCPDCQQLGYHSLLYNHLWLTHCPIHAKPLSRSTPDDELRSFCRNKKRSVSSPNPELHKSQSYAPLFYEKLSPIARFLRDPIPATPLCLYGINGAEERNTSTWYADILQSLSQADPAYASIAIRLKPRLSGHLQNVAYRTFRYHYLSFNNECDAHDLSRRPADIRHSIIDKYWPNIDLAFRTKLKKTRPNLTFDERELRKTVYQVDYWIDRELEAYKVWRSLMSFCKRPPYKPNNVIGAHLLRQDFSSNMPLIPIPLIYYEEDTYDDRFNPNRDGPTLKRTPTALSSFIFLLDCIACYLSILGYFNYILSSHTIYRKLALRGIFNFEAATPNKSLPLEAPRSDVYVFKQDSQLIVAVPQRLQHFLRMLESSGLMLC
jgi:hypothetical protein